MLQNLTNIKGGEKSFNFPDLWMGKQNLAFVSVSRTDKVCTSDPNTHTLSNEE